MNDEDNYDENDDGMMLLTVYPNVVVDVEHWKRVDDRMWFHLHILLQL